MQRRIREAVLLDKLDSVEFSRTSIELPRDAGCADAPRFGLQDDGRQFRSSGVMPSILAVRPIVEGETSCSEGPQEIVAKLELSYVT